MEKYLIGSGFWLGFTEHKRIKIYYYVYVHPSFIQDNKVVFPLANADIREINEKVLVIVPSQGKNVFLYEPYSNSEIVLFLTPYRTLYKYRANGGEGFILSTDNDRVVYLTKDIGKKFSTYRLHKQTLTSYEEEEVRNLSL